MRRRLRQLLLVGATCGVAMLAILARPLPADVRCGLGCTDECLSQSEGAQLCANICNESGYECITEDPPCPGDKVAHNCFTN